MSVLDKKEVADGVKKPKPVEGEIIEPKKTFGPHNARSGPGTRRGSRPRVARAFIADYHDAWEEHGSAVLQQLVRDDPATFVKIGAGLLPKELDVNVNKYEGISDNQLLEQFQHAVAEARTLGIDLGVGGDAREDRESEAPKAIPALPRDGSS